MRSLAAAEATFQTLPQKARVYVAAVVILGGMNSIGGVLIAGFIIGWLEAVTGLVAGTEFREITPYILVLLVLLVRPTGLFGTKEVERI